MSNNKQIEYVQNNFENPLKKMRTKIMEKSFLELFSSTNVVTGFFLIYVYMEEKYGTFYVRSTSPCFQRICSRESSQMCVRKRRYGFFDTVFALGIVRTWQKMAKKNFFRQSCTTWQVLQLLRRICFSSLTSPTTSVAKNIFKRCAFFYKSLIKTKYYFFIESADESTLFFFNVTILFPFMLSILYTFF